MRLDHPGYGTLERCTLFKILHSHWLANRVAKIRICIEFAKKFKIQLTQNLLNRNRKHICDRF